ncbi:MAG: DUF3303 family protein [archaeon]|nr:DUF3303 family protein [archaeon]
MIFLIFWKPNPEKVEEVSKKEKAGHFKIPEGLKRVQEYVMPNGSSVEIVEAKDAATVSKFVAIFLPYVKSVEAFPAITIEEYNNLF